ncbi:MAG: site-specific tyrosine recombinase XerD [candidate division WOR-3 bacterium]
MELYKFLDEFIDYLMSERGYSYHTLDGYKRDVNKFIMFIEMNNYDIENLDVNELQKFVNYLSNLGFSASSIERCIAAVRSFLKFLYIYHNINTSISELIELPRKKQFMPDVMTVEEIELLLNQPDITTEKGLRDRAIMELLYATGMRVSEALSLKVYDVNLDDRIVRISGKGNKERIVPFHETAREFLYKYLTNARSKFIKNRDNGYLFLNSKGNRLSRIGFWKILKEYAITIGLENKVHPHVFRHSFATHMLMNGCDLRILQEILGHSSISTTQRYTYISIAHLKEIHKKYHPRA